ncbi:WS/DGAT domain-containing protein, partial [Mycolicibacterium elephantis]
GPAFLQAIVSNMPGPEPAMSIAGIPLDRVVPILPLAPGAPIALGALSWTGTLGVGLAVDAELVDGGRVVLAMAQAFTELRALGVNSSSSAMN